VWESEIIYKTPGESLASDEIFAELAAAGVCVIGSNLQKVPRVPTDEVFAKLQRAIAPTTPQTAGTPSSGITPLSPDQWGLFIWAALPLFAIAGLTVLLSRRA
jgi:sarcosine oxidase gamma subunit